ncbi:MAG: Spy/CpxP family protein refolding chaperone [Cytophagia bacterium]|nr:Spy/CpxP family protein refolding chaperone [Cytophagia bacterium]NVK83546.1 Spy/CpxP family protein refolding chaperone [Cytophagia bacterium]
MKKSKTIGIAVIVLALMNVILLAFLWFGQKHNKRLISGGGGLFVLTEKLGLSEDQKDQLAVLREEHFQRMEPLRRQSHESRDRLHSLWASGGTTEQIDSLSANIGHIQAQIEKNTFQHFSEIRAICNPEQKKIFDQIIKDVLRQGERREGPPQRGADQRPPPRRR